MHNNRETVIIPQTIIPPTIIVPTKSIMLLLVAYAVSPLYLGYSNQLIQSVSRPDGGPAPRNDHNTSLNVSRDHVN